jgi:hypothetical protein
LDFYGSLFLRGSAGVYFGGQVNPFKNIRGWSDIEDFCKNWELQVSGATGVWGISAEAGGGINLDGVFAVEKRTPAEPCC